MASPAIGSPAYNNQSNAWELITTDFVTVITAFILVLSRLYTKYFLTKSAGWEDGRLLLHNYAFIEADGAWNSLLGSRIAYRNRPLGGGLPR